MTDRTVRVRLEAVTSAYTSAMARAGQSTTKFAKDAGSSAKRTATELQGVQSEATIVGASLLAMSGAAVFASARFDKSMSGVKAVSGATATEMGRLRQAALDAGQATVFSASEAAQAEAELAKAGVKTSDILSGALTGSLDLAAAGGLDLASSATIAAQAMNIFDLKGRDVAHIADVLAAGANKSAADVGQLGDALRQGGLVAAQTGLGLEDTIGALVAFADNALIGSDAGTSLKTMLQRLTPQSDEAAAKMEELGINAYDSKGQFVGLAKFAGNLKDSMKNLTPQARAAAMGIIFGSDAVRGANVLYDLGEKGVRDYTNAVDDQGAASRMAATQLDNLAGDYEQLTGSIETSFIKAGSGANDVLRDMTQAATGAVNFVGDLPEPILLAGVAAATAGGAFFIAAPRIVAFNEALSKSPRLAASARGAIQGLGPAAVVTAIAGLALDMQSASENTDRLRTEVGKLKRDLGQDITTAGIDDVRAKIADLVQQLNDPGPIKNVENALQSLWNSRPKHPIFLRAFDDSDKVLNNFENQRQMLAGLEGEWSRYTAVLGEVRYALGVDTPRAMDIVDASGVALSGTTAEIVAGVQEYVTATRAGGSATQDAAAGMNTLADATASASDQLDAYTQAWDATIGMLLGVSDANIAAEAAIDDLTKTVKENGNTWDINTQKGRANRSAFNDVISAAGKVAEKKLEETGSVEKANEAYRKYLDKLVRAPGLTDAQRSSIEQLISQGYDRLPEAVVTQVKANGVGQATTDLDRLLSKLHTINGYRAVYGVAPINPDRAEQRLSTSGTQYPASGGWVTPTGLALTNPFAPRGSDTVPAMLTPGEAIVTKSAAGRNASLIDAMNSGAVISSAPPVYVSGASGGSSGGGGLTIERLYATAAPGENAAESVPRALHRVAFENGFGG